MAVHIGDHPVLQVFSLIRGIDNGVRDQIGESLPAGMSVAQFEIIRLLDMHGDGLSTAQMLQAAHLDEGALAATLQRLQESGFVRLEPDAEEGQARIWTTPAGRETYVQAIAALRPKMEKLREAFTLEEFREAVPFLRALHTWFVERDWVPPT